MDGFKLLVISGIDGKFHEFVQIEKELGLQTVKYSYNRNILFEENLKICRNIIKDDENSKYIALGWSIGAVLGFFLLEQKSIVSSILINPFFRRSEILLPRGIECEEEVCIADTIKSKKRICIIRGNEDDKIPSIQSDKIFDFYGKENTLLITIEGAKHNLSSFSKDKICLLIKNFIKETLL